MAKKHKLEQLIIEESNFLTQSGKIVNPIPIGMPVINMITKSDLQISPNSDKFMDHIEREAIKVILSRQKQDIKNNTIYAKANAYSLGAVLMDKLSVYISFPIQFYKI